MGALLWQRPAELWNEIAEHVEEYEKAPGCRVHKGAPLFNTGLCFFFAGDFDTAMYYFHCSAEEDRLSGRDTGGSVLIGQHELSADILIRPLVGWFLKPERWGDLYAEVTGEALDEGTFVDLINWVSQLDPLDALQLLGALHGMAKLWHFDSEYSQYRRVQKLAGMVLVVESSLKKWQTGGMLWDRMERLSRSNPSIEAELQAIKSVCDKRSGKASHSTAAVNDAVDECLGRLSPTSGLTVTAKAGAAMYLVYRLRNSLMHVIDDSLDIHLDKDKLLQAAGCVFAVLRLTRHEKEGTLKAL